MELPPKIQLPPKTVKQQITGKRPDVAKVPLSSARPMPPEKKGVPLVGTISKTRPATTQTQEQPAPVQAPPAPVTITAPLPSPALVMPAAPPAPPAPAPQTTVPVSAATPVIPETAPATASGETQLKTSSNSVQKTLDSLPVLSAFQQFLDNEREIMRKRLIVLSVGYLMILLLIVGITLAGGMFMVKRLRGDFQDIRMQVAKLETLTLRNRTDADTLSKRLSSETIKIRTELNPVSDEIKNSILDKVSRHDDKLGKMDLLVQLLQKENSDLKNNLNVMQTHWLDVTNEMMTTLARIEHIRETGPINRDVEQPGPVSSSSTMALSITPRGQDHAFEWRMPIPE